nr:hypothetical protein [Tanacetum cinerariifolium]
RPVLARVLALADRDDRLLGHAGAEHSRLHPLRQEPARPGARPVARLAAADGASRGAGRHRHLGHRRPVRQGAVGSGRRGQPHDRHRGAGGAADPADRYRQRQPGRQHGRPGLRLLGAVA